MSPPLQNCLCCFFQQNKMSPLCFFISGFRSLSPFFSLSFADLPPTFPFFSVFLLLYIPNLWAWKLIDNYFRKHGYRNNSRFPFSSLLSFSWDAGGYAISRQNNLELHLVCHTELFYIDMPLVRTVGRSAGGRCTVTWLPNFLGWADLLTHDAPLARAPLIMFTKV